MLVLVINENEVILIQFEFDLPPLTLTSLIEAILVLYIKRETLDTLASSVRVGLGSLRNEKVYFRTFPRSANGKMLLSLFSEV